MNDIDTTTILRVECLKMAVSIADPDSAVPQSSVIQQAETFYRYVTTGTQPIEPVLKVVDTK
jgi:hypothetical protein